MTSGAFKVCTGPAHAQPTRIPLDEDHWPFHRSGPKAGEPTSRCKLCVNWTKLVTKDGSHGYIAASRVRALVRELVDRCGGVWAVERDHGLHATSLRSILDGETKRVQRRTVARVILALGEQRKIDRRNGTRRSFNRARVEQARIEAKAIETAGCG